MSDFHQKFAFELFFFVFLPAVLKPKGHCCPAILSAPTFELCFGGLKWTDSYLLFFDSEGEVVIPSISSGRIVVMEKVK